MKDLVNLFNFKGDKNPYKVMTRKEALKEYKEAMMCCEGSELERMTECYFDLLDGETNIYNYKFQEERKI